MEFGTPPDNSSAEITLLGTGGGYGESCLIHLGEGKWMIIDSCIDPTSGIVLPLQYLDSIGVSVDNNVIMVVCTH